MIKISAVSYLNTKPFLHGLDISSVKNKIKLTQDTPAQSAQKLLTGEIDIGLVPIAVIPQLKNPQIVSPFCIGANGKVKTVCLFSDVPLEEINTIYLDYQSRTSVLLVQLLMKEYWKRNVTFLPALEGYENSIKNNIAAVIIGDRAIANLGKYAYEYDLAEAWKQYTDLPFVFAAWVSNKEIEQDFLDDFNAALQIGWSNRSQLLEQYKNYNSPYFSVKEYWSNNIQYELDSDKKQALELFLKKINPNQQFFYCY
ncbi:MAG TPA: menaquinone biosynthesis protein [Chitinophagales bacterium]|nr:menaquinone biosynthesis protein [Chitinophagales bacterium]